MHELELVGPAVRTPNKLDRIVQTRIIEALERIAEE